MQAERKARIHILRLEEGAKKAAEELEKCDMASLFPVIIERHSK